MRKLFITILFLLGITQAYSASEIGYIYDSRDFAMVEIVSDAQLTQNINFWGFTDLYNQQGSKSATELTDYFMEYRLNYNLFPIGQQYFQQNRLEVEIEYNGFSGDSNDLARTGLHWTHSSANNGWVSLRYHPFDSRSTRFSQASFTHFIPLQDKLAFFGFYDYNIVEGADNIWYYDTSLIYSINDVYSCILTYRWDGFEHRTEGRKGNGIAIGIYRKL